ncbi:MAG TPA: type II secretion system F family protein [Acidimicrobiales bacterium]|nr:type II secretion system F family protein [Acidimicrobiales bacterium]
MAAALTFAYKVRDKSGRLLEGTLEGASMSLVAAKLQEMGYTPISIEPRSNASFQRDLKIPGLTDKVKLKDTAVFARQFATMINSGLTLVRSLGILSEQTENKALAKVIGELRGDIEKGSSLSVALGKHPKIFTPLFVSMVRSGEVSGSLDEVLLTLATTIESQVELRRRVKSAMTYPAMVMVLISIIFTAMLIFVVPQFKSMYAALGGTLPLPTRILLTVSNIFVHTFYLVVLVVGGAFYAFRRWIKTKKGREIYDTVALKAPVFGGLVHKTALARFSRTLSSLVRTGVPILESLEIVKDTCGNAVVAAAVIDCQDAVRRGEPLARPLSQHEVIPPMVTQMISVGEESGALDTMLGKVADFYDQEVAATVEALTSLIEPLLVAVMGVAVGAMVISLYMPMFNIIKLIK